MKLTEEEKDILRKELAEELQVSSDNAVQDDEFTTKDLKELLNVANRTAISYANRLVESGKYTSRFIIHNGKRLKVFKKVDKLRE